MSIDIAAGGRWRSGSTESWYPTAALVRSSVLAAALLGLAVVAGRPDLLVFGAPFAIVTSWSVLSRPSATPVVQHRTGNPVVREGDATTWRIRIEDVEHVDLVSATVTDEPWLVPRPVAGTVVVGVGRRHAVDAGEPDALEPSEAEDDDAEGSGGEAAAAPEPAGPPLESYAELAFALRSMRWGRRLLTPAHLVVVSTWGAFRAAAVTSHVSLVTLPDTSRFDFRGAMRPAHGLVGMHRSARRGEGSEFAAIRAFAPGDRIRRINWVRSLRTDELQVNATWADHDLHVELIVDATADYGESGGLDGAASSLDTAARAAAAVSAYFVQRGDRVSLRAFRPTAMHTVAAATGWRQHRRILETLSALRPAGASGTSAREPELPPWPVGDTGLTVMLSPLISRVALDRAVALGRHGVRVVVIDTMPDELDFGVDDNAALAWRLRRLERRREIRLVELAGVPVVRWTGTGSLEGVLADVARRTVAPRRRVS